MRRPTRSLHEVAIVRDVRAGHRVEPVGPPVLPTQFWDAPPIREALADRHFGRLIRAYRMHDWHGHRPVSQELMARWLGTTQPRLSRIENGSRTEYLDVLVHWATVLGAPAGLLWFSLPGETVNQQSGDLGAASLVRTRRIAASLTDTAGPAYVPDVAAVQELRRFLDSSARVFLLTGPPGAGKTTLGFRLGEHLADVADTQIHSIGEWIARDRGLHAEIVRYGNSPESTDTIDGHDLEHRCEKLLRPCVVVLDGVTTQHEMSRIARAIDRVMREVTSERLRFVVLARTPPELDVTVAPLFAATLYGDRLHPGSSYRLKSWSPAEAERAWDGWIGVCGRFAELPASVQHLARLPLHMRLLAESSTDEGLPSTTFELVGSFIRSALKGTADGTYDELVGAAFHRRSDVAAIWQGLGGASADALAGQPLPALYDAADQTEFVHDVVAEYLVAAELAQRFRHLGVSVATARAMNQLAAAASSSATTRGILAMLVRALDLTASDILAGLVVAPTLDPRRTLPLILELALQGRMGFLGRTVLLGCTRRCVHESSIELARSLLSVPGLPKAMGSEFPTWFTSVLRDFGAAMWPELSRGIEHRLSKSEANAILDQANLSDPVEARFYARYFYLFSASGPDREDVSSRVLGHRDWRVRAALADGLAFAQLHPQAARIVEALSGDLDYKVRAATARSLAFLDPEVGERVLAWLLVDDSWHVRDCALRSILQAIELGRELPDRIRRALADPMWRQPPQHIAPLVARLGLWLADPGIVTTLHDRGAERAAFRLLREARTGWAPLPHHIQATVIERARSATSWTIAREADLTERGERSSLPLMDRERFRRLRGSRTIQVALDVHDLRLAVSVATAASAAGVALFEVGDPLIKQCGIRAITEVKQAVPNRTVIAEMMSADWGRDQVEMATEAGADVVLLIGLASVTSVSSAVSAGHRLGTPIMLDTPPGPLDQRWVRDVERLGVDALVVTTNVDHGHKGGHPLDRAHSLREWTELPVAVSGGFGPSDRYILQDDRWDIAIVGRGITEAVDVAAATQEFIDLLRPNGGASA